MRKQVRLSEDELRNLIKNKILEAIEKVGLGYSPAIGNKKRGPGDDIEDQMRKRKNKKLDEAFGEINGSVVAYADKFKDADVNETIDLSNDAYAYAFEQIYGRVPGNLPDILEDFPEDVNVRFSLSIRITPQSYDFPGDRETEITGWAIDDEWVERLGGDKREIIEKAAEYVIASIDPDTLSASLNESRMISRIISESIRKVIKENKLWDAMTADMEKFAESGKDVYDFLEYATEKYGINEDQFYTSGGYEMWCDLTGEDPMDYEI